LVFFKFFLLVLIKPYVLRCYIGKAFSVRVFRGRRRGGGRGSLRQSKNIASTAIAITISPKIRVVFVSGGIFVTPNGCYCARNS
jgi:hypothetical protein